MSSNPPDMMKVVIAHKKCSNKWKVTYLHVVTTRASNWTENKVDSNGTWELVWEV